MLTVIRDVELLLHRAVGTGILGTEEDNLIMACSNIKYFNILKFLVRHGANINFKNNLGISPLICAIYHHNLDIVKFLLDNNADIEIGGPAGFTPLMLSVMVNDQQITELLLKHCANPNVLIHHGITALGLAVQKNNFEIIKCLIKAGAINTKNTKAMNPLFLAMISKQKKVM